MSYSVSDIDSAKLTVRARWTLESIAWPMSNEDVSEAAIADKLGLSRSHVAKLRAELAEEIEARTRGAQLPELRPADYEALKADIEERGLLVPILVDQNGDVVDGRHRRRACLELGLVPTTVSVHVRTVAESHDVGLAVNLARRQLTTKDKRRIIMATLILAPAKSDRAIAAAIGVSHPTVAAVRRELQERASMERFTTPDQGDDGTVKVRVRVTRATADGVKQGRTRLIVVPVSEEGYADLNGERVKVTSIELTHVMGHEHELVVTH